VDARAGAALLAAQRLEARALEAGEHGPQGLALRDRAARLRRRALAGRPYPALVCISCLAVTGWLDRDGSCDRCLHGRLLSESFADPHGSWVDLSDMRTPPSPRTTRRGLFRSRPDNRAVHAEWLRLVDPDETGPIEPEDGYVVEVAQRSEHDAGDGSCVLVQFTTAAHRFHGASWSKLASTTVATGAILTPATFPTDLPIEQLAEAWGDFRNEIHLFNANRWESQRRDAEEHVRAERTERRTSIADLLDDD
jgi:hypothetical protein